MTDFNVLELLHDECQVLRTNQVDATSDQRVRIQIMGGFRVVVNGRTVRVPGDQPQRLLKFLACRGGRASLSEIADALWPDVEVSLGQRRVRNVLSRIRTALGEVVVRDAAVLRFAETVTVDTVMLGQAVHSLANRDPGSFDSACGLLASVDVPLVLPEEAAPWTEVPRERSLRDYGFVTDMLAKHCLREGDIPGAIRWWHAALDANPYDEVRAVTAAQRLIASGFYAAAKHFLDRAESMAAELDVPVSQRVRALRLAAATEPSPSSA